MLHMDEDDFLVGSPKSKFFDVLYHANKSVVENSLLDLIERHVVMESLLEKFAAENGFDLEQEIIKFKVEKQDELYNRTNDFFIATVGDIVTQG